MPKYTKNYRYLQEIIEFLSEAACYMPEVLELQRAQRAQRKHNRCALFASAIALLLGHLRKNSIVLQLRLTL
jgi:hypothetical protein